MNKVTEKQAYVIELIEKNLESLNVKFKGESKEEASQFISEHIEDSKKESRTHARMRFEDEANSFGLPNQ